MLLIFFLILISSLQAKQDDVIQQEYTATEEGYQHGQSMLEQLIEYRKQFNIRKTIKHSSSLQSIVESQVKYQIENPKQFAQHEGFESRSKLYHYYSEFVTKLVIGQNPAKDALTMWKQNDETKDDLLSEFNEGAGYCSGFGDGWICELILVQTK